MKIKTALHNIELEKQRHELAMQQLQISLKEAIELDRNKTRASLINKFATVFDMAPEVVEKKILPKAKRQCDAQKIEEMRLIHENQAIMYEQKNYNGKTYHFQNKPGGIVMEKDDNGQTRIVGYMSGDIIVFTTVI